MSGPTEDFRRELLRLGFIAYHEQDTLWSIAMRCAASTGLPMGVAVGLATMNVGTVVVPGVGTLSGGVAGFLAGLTTGTVMCAAANWSYRSELRKLLDK